VVREIHAPSDNSGHPLLTNSFSIPIRGMVISKTHPFLINDVTLPSTLRRRFEGELSRGSAGSLSPRRLYLRCFRRFGISWVVTITPCHVVERFTNRGQGAVQIYKTLRPSTNTASCACISRWDGKKLKSATLPETMVSMHVPLHFHPKSFCRHGRASAAQEVRTFPVNKLSHPARSWTFGGKTIIG